MYSLIWVGWLLVKLFIKNHQFFYRDRSFFQFLNAQNSTTWKLFIVIGVLKFVNAREITKWILFIKTTKF